MQLIDWGNLLANALWVVGCAIALGLSSYAAWEARQVGVRVRERLSLPSRQAVLGVAGALACAGLAGTAQSALESIAWGLIGVVCLVWTIRRWLLPRLQNKA